MALDCASHEFRAPQRIVCGPEDIEKWEKSGAYQDIIGFLTMMNNAVKGRKLSALCQETDITKGLCHMLHTFSQWVDEIPPIEQAQRYGNKAFRDFYNRLATNAQEELKKSLPDDFHPAIIEICPYLVESFGNATRIDYGTGHELSFIMFLCCLHKLGALIKEDSMATVTKIFSSYLNLTRKLQTIYKMEPAGSQGVWSLDDFQFIPFYWGSSQLMMNAKISPDMFTNENVVNENCDEYLFLSCVKYILSVKKGPFAEHSNQLWNISGVQSWTKINQGLLKMYKAEILHKFPIIQHVLFGSLLTITPYEEARFQSPSDLGSIKRPVPIPKLV